MRELSNWGGDAVGRAALRRQNVRKSTHPRLYSVSVHHESGSQVLSSFRGPSVRVSLPYHLNPPPLSSIYLNLTTTTESYFPSPLLLSYNYPGHATPQTMISHRSKKPSTPSDMVPVITVAAAQRLDITKEDPESAPRSLSHSLSFDGQSYERFPLGPALAPGGRLNWLPTHLPPITSISPRKIISTAPSRVLSSAMPRTLPFSPIRPQSSTWTHTDGPATGIQCDRALSSHLKADSTQVSLPPPPPRSRGFFDIVLAPPVHIPAAKEPDTALTDLRAPSKPTSVTSRRAPPAGNAGKRKKKRAPKRKVPTPEPESSSSEDESNYDPEDESSDEDEPAPSRGPVKLMRHGSEITQPDIPTSNVRDYCSPETCSDTRMQFDHEYSRHTRVVVLATKPARFGPRSVSAAVRKSSRLAATRSATPASTAIDSATDISVSSVAGSSRAVSVASTTATAPRSKPKSKPKPKTPRSKSVSRLSTGSNSSRDLSTPQPVSTSIAHPSSDPPPPAPTNIVSLRPGYNAYTPEDKQWFLDFVGWVFRQNVRAGKAEICQDIFQQAPHHRLESWKSYWRDHISQVEMLRNIARERLLNPEPKRKPASPSSSSTSTSSNGAAAFDREANKASEGLWKLAELAELQGPVPKSNKRTADDATTQQRTKRFRY
ncbi:hypothetical protein B0J17DRAFT_712805 [Rhizoctonia solani]|nr:hypothetical protein B0J17DRAFT_712805 [Rhizoctonia solani]